MSRRRLTWDELTLISLLASPSRLMGIEARTLEDAAEELFAEVHEYPTRTRLEIQRYGRGTPTVRGDLVARALGEKKRWLREQVLKQGHDHRDLARDVEVLSLAGELAGGLDEAVVARYEWPQ